MLEKIEDRRSGWHKMKWLDGITDLKDICLCKLWEIVKDREAWFVAVHGVAKCQTWPNDSTSPYIFKKVWAKVISIPAVLVLGKNDLNIKSGIPWTWFNN